MEMRLNMIRLILIGLVICISISNLVMNGFE